MILSHHFREKKNFVAREIYKRHCYASKSEWNFKVKTIIKKNV